MSIAPGTPVEGLYGSYTAEQLETLERLKDRRFTLGIATADMVNMVLHPDGSMSDDVISVIKASEAALKNALSGDMSDPDVLDKAKFAAIKVREVASHIEDKRFLFVVDTESMPVVYFQCAVEGNPDTPMLVADHPDPSAHAVHAAEVAASLQQLIADSYLAAKKGA